MRDTAKIFMSQLPSGEIPTLMVNEVEGWKKAVNTSAITMVAVYLAQLHPSWEMLWNRNIQKALNFIEQNAFRHETEGYLLCFFNGFYQSDWESTSFMIYLLEKNGRLTIDEFDSIRKLFLSNVSDNGVGIWVKDSYSSDNEKNNQWDPTSSLNILRLYYLLKIDRSECDKAEKFIMKYLTLRQFAKSTLYYTAPVAAFFAKRLISDFSIVNDDFVVAINNFHQEVVEAIIDESLRATSFEKTLLGLDAEEVDNGLIFHHGRRNEVWYGSPVLHKLASTIEMDT